MAAIKPLLFISDAITAPTGLARITGDLAKGVHSHLADSYEVATFGPSGIGDRHLGFTQYPAEGVDEFLLPTLPPVWDNFAGKEKGAILCVWDASRLSWFSAPHAADKTNEPKYRGLQQWLMKPPFERWIYCPIDGGGPNDRLTFPIMKILQGFDRIIAYSEWGKNIIAQTIGEEAATKTKLCALPHGIDGSVFTPSSDRRLLRSVFPTLTQSFSVISKTRPVKPHETLIGIVATNQRRKDWALGIETVALLNKAKNGIRLWIHTDKLSADWDLVSLLIDYQLLGETTLISTGYIPDDQMADAYSACDLTIGIGPEGFGYPIFESMFCGTPCIHGHYSGAAEHMPGDCLVEPVAYRLDGAYSIKRPVYRASDFGDAALRVLGWRTAGPAHLEWKNLWPRWEAWFKEGL